MDVKNTGLDKHSRRHTLLEIATVRQASEGQQTKMEMVYQYLTGPQFRQRIEAIVEAFSSMHENLHKEKKAINKQWAKREEQIDRVMQATVGCTETSKASRGRRFKKSKAWNRARWMRLWSKTKPLLVNRGFLDVAVEKVNFYVIAD